MCASPEAPSGRTTTVGVSWGKEETQIKGLICFRRWLHVSILQTCILLKGKQQLAPVPQSVSGSHLPGGSFPPKSDWDKRLHSLALPACSNFRTAKFCRWGGSPRKGPLSKRHPPQFPRQAPASPPCTSKSSSHPPCPMPQDECHLASH